MIFFVLYKHKVYNNPCNMMFHTSEYFDVIILPKVIVFIGSVEVFKIFKSVLACIINYLSFLYNQ